MDTGARVIIKLVLKPDSVGSSDVNLRITQAMENAQAVGSWEAPLGRALRSLEQIMNIVGGVAEVVKAAADPATTHIYFRFILSPRQHGQYCVPFIR